MNLSAGKNIPLKRIMEKNYIDTKNLFKDRAEDENFISKFIFS